MLAQKEFAWLRKLRFVHAKRMPKAARLAIETVSLCREDVVLQLAIRKPFSPERQRCHRTLVQRDDAASAGRCLVLAELQAAVYEVDVFPLQCAHRVLSGACLQRQDHEWQQRTGSGLAAGVQQSTLFLRRDRLANLLARRKHIYLGLDSRPDAGTPQDGPQRAGLVVDRLWRGFFFESIILVGPDVLRLDVDN